MSKVGNPRWVKGQSGNPGGRTKQDYRIKELALKKCPWALKRLEDIAKQDEDLRSAVAATMGILAYGIGKPTQQIDLTNSDGSMSQAWLTAIRSIDTDEPQAEAEASVQH